MAYQNVGTPRFYVNVLEWLSSVGEIWNLDSRYRTLPVNPVQYRQTSANPSVYPFPVVGMSDKSFIAILGHNIASSEAYYQALTDDGQQTTTGIVNFGTSPNQPDPQFDGFSISTFDGDGATTLVMGLSDWADVGSIVMGTYYDMPHSPDLSLTMTREYGGIKTIETKGGASLSNRFYSKSPSWGDAGAWELYQSGQQESYQTGIPELSRSGRRVWDLNFSYLSSFDLSPPTESTTFYITDPDELGTGSSGSWVATNESGLNAAGTATTRHLLSSDDFYSQVIHKTSGQLPFIFQPDSSNNNQFAICKFDQKSFSFQQQAPNLYSVKMKIREVW